MDNELMSLLAEKFGLAFDYVESNFADVFNRYVKWEIIKNALGISISVVIIVTTIVWLVLCLKRSKIKGSFFRDDFFNCISEPALVVLVVLGFFAIIGLTVCFIDTFYLIAWSICPEVQMLKVLK